MKSDDPPKNLQRMADLTGRFDPAGCWEDEVKVKQRAPNEIQICYGGLLYTKATQISGTSHYVFQFGNGTWGCRRLKDIYGCCGGPTRAEAEEAARECESNNDCDERQPYVSPVKMRVKKRRLKMMVKRRNLFD